MVPVGAHLRFMAVLALRQPRGAESDNSVEEWWACTLISHFLSLFDAFLTSFLVYILFLSSSQPSRSPFCFFITLNALSHSMSFIKSEPQHWGNVSLMLLGMQSHCQIVLPLFHCCFLFTPPIVIHCERNWAPLFRVLKDSKREQFYNFNYIIRTSSFN